MNQLNYINIKHLFGDFYNSIKECFFLVFVLMPLLGGIILTIVLYGQIDNTKSVICSFLTSFVPVFATILTIYTSWAFQKLNTRHDKDRACLISETTTAILCLIPLDLITLFVSLFTSVHIFDSVYIIDLHQYIDTTILNVNITVGWIIRALSQYLFYSLFLAILMLILLVTKRTYRILTGEIIIRSELKTKIPKENNSD